MSGKQQKLYKSFEEFYPFYLTEHSNPVNRSLHFGATTVVIVFALYIFLTQSWSKLIFLPLCGYGPAWVGHFFFEKNRPATFTYPRWSLFGDFVMWYQIVTGKIAISGSAKK